MNSAIERLLSLRVCDVMNPQVVALSEELSISEATRTLDQEDVRGAPVVNRDGLCVGVLSMADVALFGRSDCNGGLAAKTTVAEVMSPVVQTISPQAPIMNAARALCREHIHRLVIVDAEKKPVGVLSSLDLVAAMVAAVEE